MKSLYLTSFLFIGLAANAQLTQNNHAPAAGDVHNTFQCDSLGVSPGASGANATWNYSSIVTHSSVAKVYTVNPYSQAAYAPADVVKFSSQTDNAYYRSTSNDLKYYGGSIAVSTVVATLIYSNPAIRGAYPMTLNTTSTTAISGTMNLTQPLPVSATFNGNSSIIADGTGTLMLPGGAQGTFTNVMRTRSSQTLNFTVTFPPTTGTLTQVIYEYYSIGTKAPLFSITSSTVVNAALGTVTGSVVNINQNYLTPTPTVAPVGLNEQHASAVVVNVFPNPASGIVTLATDNEQAANATIFDATGKQVDKLNFIDNKVKLDVSSYSNGLYIYKVTNAAGDNLKTGKIAVNH